MSRTDFPPVIKSALVDQRRASRACGRQMHGVGTKTARSGKWQDSLVLRCEKIFQSKIWSWCLCAFRTRQEESTDDPWSFYSSWAMKITPFRYFALPEEVDWKVFCDWSLLGSISLRIEWWSWRKGQPATYEVGVQLRERFGCFPWPVRLQHFCKIVALRTPSPHHTGCYLLSTFCAGGSHSVGRFTWLLTTLWKRAKNVPPCAVFCLFRVPFFDV